MLGDVRYHCDDCAARGAAERADERDRYMRRLARGAEAPGWLSASPPLQPDQLAGAMAEHERRQADTTTEAWASRPPYLQVLSLADATDAFEDLFRNPQYLVPEELLRGNPRRYESVYWSLLHPRDGVPTAHENALRQTAYMGSLRGGEGARDVYVGSVFRMEGTGEIAVLWCWRALETFYD
ncbi:hypothetical protein ABZY14_40280 [Streptomyces sp. NPDC006617]|uniref:hypothetical protein n=1 Tax=Streptomyces sp. NPDC006617 TaxID=3155354 RepID=UPI0033A128D6